MRLATVSDKKFTIEPFWHVQIAIVVALCAQLVVSDKLVFSSKYIIVGLEILLLGLISYNGLSVAVKRVFALSLVTVVGVANVSSLGLVVDQLLNKGGINPKQLLLSGVAIYITSIILFGILYWELDSTRPDEADFLFPQMGDPPQKNWQPSFFDYLYIAITCASAFSPTDTMPLTHRAKFLMTVHGALSLTTVALVAARAVNILG
jgi:uncharacterized membrane protein